MKRHLVLFLFFLGLSACSSFGSLVLKDQDRSLRVLRKVIVTTIPKGVRKVSRNGRTFFSHYFLPTDPRFRHLKRKKIRFMTRITILGDMRPYDIEVLTRRYKVQTDKYGSVIEAQDLGLAPQVNKKIFKSLKKRLIYGRDTMNIIDDFKVF
ncbi:MAG: hypothetical protein D6797_04330 [Bdellovibrio sp.]|nr:MAG: hypothetical protein D6797_04330 [Bdellovibrio sp.]